MGLRRCVDERKFSMSTRPPSNQIHKLDIYAEKYLDYSLCNPLDPEKQQFKDQEEMSSQLIKTIINSKYFWSSFEYLEDISSPIMNRFYVCLLLHYFTGDSSREQLMSDVDRQMEAYVVLSNHLQIPPSMMVAWIHLLIDYKTLIVAWHCNNLDLVALETKFKEDIGGLTTEHTKIYTDACNERWNDITHVGFNSLDIENEWDFLTFCSNLKLFLSYIALELNQRFPASLVRRMKETIFSLYPNQENLDQDEQTINDSLNDAPQQVEKKRESIEMDTSFDSQNGIKEQFSLEELEFDSKEELEKKLAKIDEIRNKIRQKLKEKAIIDYQSSPDSKKLFSTQQRKEFQSCLKKRMKFEAIYKKKVIGDESLKGWTIQDMKDFVRVQLEQNKDLQMYKPYKKYV